MKVKENLAQDWEMEWAGHTFRFTDMTYTEVCEELEGLVDIGQCKIVATKPLRLLQPLKPLSEPLISPLRALKKEV